tara:strand:+ start:386 stop:1027 length:642 start_codon:yes stop_codon:yes gene_type:complete
MRNISPSILSADFSIIKDQLESVKKSGATRVHLDVMDGNFVPNLTFGPMIIKSIDKLTDLHLETHLMIKNPHKYIKDYISAGSDTLIFHYEASKNIKKDIETIKENDVLAGIAVNPDTNYKNLIKYLDILDYILVMSVFPGFGGQKFIEKTLLTIKELSSLKRDKNFTIGVDGGVNLKTIDKVYNAGADITIVGSALFGAKNINKQFELLLNE